MLRDFADLAVGRDNVNTPPPRVTGIYGGTYLGKTISLFTNFASQIGRRN